MPAVAKPNTKLGSTVEEIKHFHGTTFQSVSFYGSVVEPSQTFSGRKLFLIEAHVFMHSIPMVRKESQCKSWKFSKVFGPTQLPCAFLFHKVALMIRDNVLKNVVSFLPNRRSFKISTCFKNSANCFVASSSTISAKSTFTQMIHSELQYTKEQKHFNYIVVRKSNFLVFFLGLCQFGNSRKSTDRRHYCRQGEKSI